MSRVLVTGSRELDDYQAVWAALYERLHAHVPAIVMHGACPTGADQIASEFVRCGALSLIEERFPADWARHGRAAGPLRNQLMIDQKPDLVIAFFLEGAASRGTADCVRRARAAGIPVDAITVPKVSR